MSMKFKYLAASVCLLVSLAGCREEMVIKGSYVEPGCGVLNVSVSSHGTLTRAVGDYLPEATFPEEREVRSIAFFVKTENDTKGDKALAGTFARFFSHSADPELALAEPLAEIGGTGSGIYNCGIRMYSDSWKSPQVIVVANYVENGLQDVLEGVSRWDELQDLLTPENVRPRTPLLMYGKETVVNWTDAGGVAAASIGLQRMVSRIDVRNGAFDDTDASKGFVLESVSLVRPKAASFLLPPTADMLAYIRPATSGYTTTTLTGDALTDKEKQRVDSLYVYENPNAAPDGVAATTATAVRITGKYLGHDIVKTIALAQKNGTPIALRRNYRYLVHIRKGADPQEPAFELKVAEWEKGDSLYVTPVYKAPGFEHVNKSEALIGWNSEKKAYTVPTSKAAAPGNVQFRVKSESQRYIAVDTIAVYKAAGDSVIGHSELLKGKITPDAAGIVQEGATFSCVYKLDIPVKLVDGVDKEPLHSVRLVFANSVYPEATDTLTIKYE